MAAPRYPDAPGWKGKETSRLAAQAIAPKQKRLWEQVLEAFRQGPATPEQITDRLNRMGGRRFLLMSVRPRCSELGKKGLIRDTGRRGIGEGGAATVWELPPAPPPAVIAAPNPAAPQHQLEPLAASAPLLAWAESEAA